MKKWIISLPLFPLLFLLLYPGLAQSDFVAYLTVINPTVELRRVGTTQWVTVSIESVIGPGDIVRTDNNGTAGIRLLDGNTTMTLESDTELRINRLEHNEDGYAVSIELVAGTLQQTIVGTPDAPTSYELITPTMTVLYQTGQFEVQVDPDGLTNLLVVQDTVFIIANGQVIEVPSGSGLRTNGEGIPSAVLPAASFEQLGASLDGVAVSFATDADVQLNVRSGPNANLDTLGTIAPDTISVVNGISRDGIWYRIPFQDEYGWVSGASMDVTADTSLLVVFDMDHVEVSPPPVESPPSDDPEPVAEVETSQSSLAQTQSDFTSGHNKTERETIAALNAWRLEVGLWPLQPNPTLTRMARDQANYLMSFPSLPGDVHIDALGRYPRQRAVEEYDWPAYGNTARVSVGENVYVGASTDIAISYWQGSSIHNQTVTNAAYREIGVATVPHAYGNLYVVVFGSRPNVFPALTDPTSNTLYFSGERYQYAAGGDWIATVQEYQIVPTVLSPLQDDMWLPWSGQMTLASSEPFVIAYRDDEKLVMLQVDPQVDIAWLPANLPAEEEPPAASVPAAIPTALPTNTPLPR